MVCGTVMEQNQTTFLLNFNLKNVIKFNFQNCLNLQNCNKFFNELYVHI